MMLNIWINWLLYYVHRKRGCNYCNCCSDLNHDVVNIFYRSKVTVLNRVRLKFFFSGRVTFNTKRGNAAVSRKMIKSVSLYACYKYVWAKIFLVLSFPVYFYFRASTNIDLVLFISKSKYIIGFHQLWLEAPEITKIGCLGPYKLSITGVKNGHKSVFFRAVSTLNGH